MQPLASNSFVKKQQILMPFMYVRNPSTAIEENVKQAVNVSSKKLTSLIMKQTSSCEKTVVQTLLL